MSYKQTEKNSPTEMSNFVNVNFFLYLLLSTIFAIESNDDDHHHQQHRMNEQNSNLICKSDNENIREIKIPVPVIKEIPELRIIRIPYKVQVKIPIFIPIDEKETQRDYYEGKQPYNVRADFH
ncbi:uncharacterized protein LOC113799445 [Dermatophagoides pteronyssinus]|uniref:uncharacterized protein LOC113799445 n=1 Tax=Dermatophagoides pteronyssinus TaxID=6956 RepID=UPI003F67FE46